MLSSGQSDSCHLYLSGFDSNHTGHGQPGLQAAENFSTAGRQRVVEAPSLARIVIRHWYGYG